MEESFSNGQSTDRDSIESYMLQYDGGDVSILEQYWNEGIAILQINNPDKRNAISGKMMVDFRKCIDRLEKWQEGKAVILCGFGDNFCSGGDLDFARKCHTTKDGFYLSYLMQDVLNRMRKLPLISVALLHGPALGGGSEISVSCDYILVCRNVKFGFVHGKMGIVPAWGGETRLIQKIGEQKALDILLTSKILNAEECLDIGLARKILENDNKLEQCLEWTRIHTQHHFTVVRALKQISLLDTEKYDVLIKREREIFLPLWGGPANREALSRNIKHVNRKKTEDLN